MEKKSWVVRCLFIFLVFQVFRGVMSGGYIMMHFLDVGIHASNELSATKVARCIETICVGSFSVPVSFALVKSKPYTGNLLDWYLIVFVWCISIRQIVELVYDKNSLLPIVFTFVINVFLCRSIVKAFQRHHPSMYNLAD